MHLVSTSLLHATIRSTVLVVRMIKIAHVAVAHVQEIVGMFDGVLVGSALMRSAQPGALIREILQCR